MKFCGFCGQQIPDDANACPYCGSFQDSAAPAAPAKKPFPVKTLVAALVALAVVVGLVFAAKAIFGGGYKKPLDTLCDIANDKKVSESVLKDAARCVAGDVGKKDVDAAIDEVCGLKADGTKLISFL
ncbi:MAG: zinc-ribbon domain-containing protein, partial [Pyramidobacter sp.]|nr:zinc-ribbon domain-containing protein [Pyramidobacter sp.]